MRKIIYASLITLLLLLLTIPVHAAIYYVNDDSTGSNSGQDWGNAFNDLQVALDSAVTGDQIWVASGTYYPSIENGSTGTRFRSFQMKNGVSIYGGFEGSEISLDERDFESNETIISGDIGTKGDNSDNSYHVFFHPSGTDLDATAVLDGFTVSGGNANGQVPGGGMYNYLSSPTLNNCTFSGNISGENGGGICNLHSSPILTNCSFNVNAILTTLIRVYICS